MLKACPIFPIYLSGQSRHLSWLYCFCYIHLVVVLVLGYFLFCVCVFFLFFSVFFCFVLLVECYLDVSVAE